jgi:hypothetical protein
MTPSPAFQFFPDWYALLYVKPEPISFRASFAACIQWLANLMLWAVDLTWNALLQADTRLVELILIGNEAWFAWWILHRELSRPFGWAMALFCAAHILIFRHRDVELRQMCLSWDLLWIAAILLGYHRSAVEAIGEGTYAILWLGGLVSLFALRRSSVRGGGISGG